MKFKNWDGKSLQGDWMVTIKIDGIQGRKDLISEQKLSFYLVSKKGQILTNLPKGIPSGEIFEIFNGTCNGTWSTISSPQGSKASIRAFQIYPLFPKVDERLILIKSIKNPSANKIQSLFTKVRLEGHEGLVLRRLDKDAPFIKVKASYTVDTKIIGFVEGKGRLKGKLGKFLTENGGVGVGMTDIQREQFWKDRPSLLGTTIEVKCMEMTVNNKFRQPVFLKLRPDK